MKKQSLSILVLTIFSCILIMAAPTGAHLKNGNVGDFDFEKKELKEIILELGRWHGYDAEFPKNLSKRTYTGSFRRTRSLREMLHFFEILSGYKIVVIGKKIIVMPRK